MKRTSLSHPTRAWFTLGLAGLALLGGVAAAAPAANPTWVARYRDDTPVNWALDMAVDAAGNSYVLGRDGGFDEGSLFIVKYNTAGSRQWVSGYSPTDPVDYEGRISLDSTGNLLVAASTRDEDNQQSVLVFKFDPAGALVWDVTRAVPDVNTDVLRDMALDASGDVYLTGSRTNALDGSLDLQVLKFDGTDGAFTWEADFGGAEDTNQTALDLAVDSAGGVFVAGAQFIPAASANGLIVKFDAANGARLWEATYDGPDEEDDFWTALTLVGSGVAVTGVSEGTEGTDIVTAKYNAADGDEVWTSRFDGPATAEESLDGGNGVTADPAGNVYVTGYSAANGAAAFDYTTIKYNGANGSQAWVARFDGPGAEEPFDSVDEASRIRLDAAGNVYVTGSAIGSQFHYDIGTVKYNASGVVQWSHVFNGRGLDDFPAALSLDGAGNVYVAGMSVVRESKDSDNDSEIVVLKLLPTGRGTPVARIPKPTFTFSENANDKLVCSREEGETFCDEATTRTFKISSTATMQGIDLTTFSEETAFALSVGDLQLERTLGDDPHYAPGKTKATLVENVLDEDKRSRKALTITVSWPRGKLKVTVASTPYFESGILAGDYLDEETGRITETTSASVSLGNFTQEFNVAVAGKVTSRLTRDEEFTLSTVTLTGKGTGL